MLNSDAAGFLAGAPATDLLRRIADGQDEELELLRKIASDTGTVAVQARQQVRVARASSPSVPNARVVAATAIATAAAVVKATSQRKPAALPARNSRGQFTAGSGRVGSPGGSQGRRPATPNSPRGAGARSPFFIAGRRLALGELAGQAADVDATAGAARETVNVAKPLVHLFRGDSESRREKREERKANVRQKRSETWYKRIWTALGGGNLIHSGGGKGAGSGLLGILAAFMLPLLARLASPFRTLGGMAGNGLGRLFGGIGRRLPKFLRNSRFLRGAGRFLSRARIPVIGTLLAALGYASDAYGDEHNPNLTAAQKRDARFRNGGRAAGGIVGGIGGGIIGGMLLGPVGAVFGAWLGGVGGEMLGTKFGEWTKSLIDADIPGKLAMQFGDFVDFLKKSPVVKKVVGAYDKAVQITSVAIEHAADKAKSAGSSVLGAGRNLLDRIGLLESGGDYGNQKQRTAYLAGRGGTTASGKYQFLDGTFAGLVAKHGASDPALAGLAPLAAAYVADRRSTRAKAMDPTYSPLFAAKLNPGSADAVMRIFTAGNQAKLAAAGIASPTDEQVYATHFSGSTALARALGSNPGALLSSVLSPAQIAANQGLLGGLSTVGQLQAKLHRKLMRGVPAGTPSAPAGSFLAGLGTLPNVPGLPDFSVPPIAGDGGRPKLIAVPVPAIGQNVSDRGIAHVATGGIGMNGLGFQR
ncbi:MAG: hypothetical protein ISP90_02895 [Nevskia sp.]|nr:hypothetical protein [Nevskia sp.]